jgi:6-phosphofructokinase
MFKVIKSGLQEHANKEYNKMPLTIKYLDAKDTIRASTPNAEDSQLCQRLGQAAVDSAMTGFTDHTVGIMRN